MNLSTLAFAAPGLAALLVLTAGCGGDPRPLTGGEIEILLSGNTAYIKNRNGLEQTAHLGADGTAKVRNRGAESAEKASWHVMGDSICHDLRPVYKCYRIWPQDDGAYVAQSIDDAWQPRLTVKKGNPEGL
jgi:hypothetical protein